MSVLVIGMIYGNGISNNYCGLMVSTLKWIYKNLNYKYTTNFKDIEMPLNFNLLVFVWSKPCLWTEKLILLHVIDTVNHVCGCDYIHHSSNAFWMLKGAFHYENIFKKRSHGNYLNFVAPCDSAYQGLLIACVCWPITIISVTATWCICLIHLGTIAYDQCKTV